MIRNIIWAFLLVLLAASSSYTKDKPASGVSTGVAKVYTSRRTTGIVDTKAARIFEDATAQSNLKQFKCVSGGKDKEYIIEVTACTVAVFDYDNDGKPDIYFLNGSTIKAEMGNEPPPKSALFRNLGNWKFENVTERAGVANERWGMGVNVADYNNDGFADIFVMIEIGTLQPVKKL